MSRLFNRIKSIPDGVKSASVYTVSSVFTRGLAIITVPIFSRLMTTEQVGIVNLFTSWYFLISAFATLSLTSGGFSVAMKEYSDRRDEYISSVLSLTSLIAVLLGIIYFVMPSFWQSILGLPNILIVLMLIGFLVAPARDFWLARQRYEYKYKLPGAVSIFSALFAAILSVYVVIVLNRKGVVETAISRLISNYIVIYGTAAVIWLYLMLKGKKLYSKEYWTMSLSISMPLVGYSIASQILSVSDRMMISKIINNSAVGIYGTLYTVSVSSIMVWQAINSSFIPYLFQNIEKKEHDIKRISNMMMIAFAFVSVLLTYAAPEIVRILATKEYYEAIYIMPPIAAGVFFISYSNLYSNIVVYYKNTKYIMYPAIIAAVMNVILNYIFINMFGYMAAAYTTLISYIVLSILQSFWCKKVCKINDNDLSNIYDNKFLFVLAVITVIASLLGLALYLNIVIRYILFIIVLVLFFMYCNWVYKIYIKK